MTAANVRLLVATLLVFSGLGVIGWVALDDTGDDVGVLSVEQAAGTDPVPGDSTIGLEAATPSAPPDTGVPTTTDSDADSTAASDTQTSQDAPTTAPRPAAPEIGRSSARIADVDLSPPPPPTGIALPSIGVDAPVVPVGVDPDGLMTVPEDVDTVGWYRFGGAPGGAEGTSVLAGHVDSRSQGRGAFFDLRAMDVGDLITVADEGGTETTWKVTGRRTYEKDSLPIDDLYRRDGGRRLVLITCGGDFDADVRSYESNVVVEAEPVA